MPKSLDIHVRSLRFWKHLTNIWSVIAFAVFILHFFSRGTYEAADSLINIIYPAVLTIYTSQKEFSRWRGNNFTSKFAGEYFIFYWTVLFIFFAMVSVLSRGAYEVTLEMVTTYLAVLSIYAVTLKSKEMRRRH